MSKKIALRQCTGCREMMPKSDLVRVVKSAQGTVQLDKQGKLPGRGAYLCKKELCLKKIQKSKALERGLSTCIPPEVYDELCDLLHQLRQEVDDDA